MDFEQMVAFAVKHKLKYIQPFSKHINPMAPKEEILAKKAVLDTHGLTCYTFGVTGTYKEKEKNRKLFEFAKLMNIKIIVVEPGDQSQWDVLEELVKEYNIKLAIHNHGINSTYGSPKKVWKVIRNRDKRIGVCMDVGHITGAGFDAAKAFTEYKDACMISISRIRKSRKSTEEKLYYSMLKWGPAVQIMTVYSKSFARPDGLAYWPLKPITAPLRATPPISSKLQSST